MTARRINATDEAVRARIQAMLGSGAMRHWGPIMRAVIEHDVALITIFPDAGRVFLPARRPLIVFLGDDLDVSRGPDAFDPAMLNETLACAASAAIMASAPVHSAYAAVAAMAGGFGLSVLLVETTPLHEAEWIAAVRARAPELSLLVTRVRGGTA